MAQTITPVVHGGRRGPWAGSVVVHAVGATLSAAALGAALGGIGSIADAPWGWGGAALVATIAATYAARELLGVPVPLPQLQRQVPDWWRTFFSRPVAALLYGAGLGVAFVTYLSFGTFVAVAAAAVASGNPAVGAAVVAPFGLARGLSVLIAWGSITTGRDGSLAARLESLARSRWPRLVNGVVLVTVVAAAVAAAIGARGRPAAELPAWILAGAFAWAATSKVLRPAAWRRALGGYALSRGVEPAAAVAVPAAELAVPVLAVTGALHAAAWLGVGLLATFSAAVVRARLLGASTLDCGCFGRRRAVDYRAALARNAALIAAGVVAILEPVPRGAGLGLGAPHGGGLLAAALVGAGVALMGVVVGATVTLLRSGPRRARGGVGGAA